MQRLKELWQFAFVLCRQDINERFAGSLLGATWIFIWPMVQLAIYIIIFGKMMGGRFSGEAQVYSYGVYVASGLITWTCFANTLQRTSRILMEKRQIIAKVNVPLTVFPLFICLAELVPFTLSVVVLALVDALSGWWPDATLLLYALLAIYCQQVLAVGVGLVGAICAVFIRDVTEILSIVLQVGFWFTPIVYVVSILPEWVQSALVLNPLYHVTSVLQNCFIFGRTPGISGLLYVFVFSHAALVFGLWLMKKLEKDIRDVL